MKWILQFFVIIFGLCFISGVTWAQAFTFTETYTPSGFYTSANLSELSKIKVITDSDKVIYELWPGDSLKIQIIVPPGIEQFSSNIQVAKWKTNSTTAGEYLYAKSLTNYADVESYNPTFATSYPFQFINTSYDDSSIPLVTVSNQVLSIQRTAYMIFHNTTYDKVMYLKSIAFSMKVNSNNIDTYNSWVEVTGKNLPIKVNLNGNFKGYGSSGGSNSSSSSSSSSTGGSSSGGPSSSSSSSSSSSGGPNDCSPILNNCNYTPTPTPTPTTTPAPTPTSTPEPTPTPQPTPVPEENTTETDNMVTGTYVQINSVSGDNYILWDSIADNYRADESRHIRLRIESEQFDQIRDKLTAEQLKNKNILPDVTGKRDRISILNDDGGLINLYPYAENSDSLLDALREMFPGQVVGLTPKGLIYIVTEQSFLYGYLDYYISKPHNAFESSESQHQFILLSLEGDLSTYEILYPSGAKQKMYVYGNDIINIEK